MGFAEEEFWTRYVYHDVPESASHQFCWTSCLKLTVIALFLVASFVFVLGGGPSSGVYNEYWGARLWYNPGAFANGFKGVCSVFVTAAFS